MISLSNQTPPIPTSELGEHIFRTYIDLRIGMGIIALLFPFVLLAFGTLVGVEWQPSMSHYYFGLPAQDILEKQFPGLFPTRVVFSGILFALGTFLILYRGFTPLENVLLDIAGFCALVVALCPMSYDYGPGFHYNTLYKYLALAHNTFAYLLFASMAIVAWFCASKTLKYLPAEQSAKKAWFEGAYGIIAVAMIALPGAALISWLIVPHNHLIFVLEALAVIAFASYWLVKSYEMRLSEAEKQALTALPRNPLPGKPSLPNPPPSPPNA